MNAPLPPGRGPRSSTRNANVGRVLDVLRSEGPASQAAIARRCGLSPATVNTIVKELRQQGAAEVKPINGREALVSLVSNRGTLVVVEVGHDSVHGTAFAMGSGERHDAEVAHRSDPQTVLDTVTAVARKAGTSVAQLTGVAVAMHAPIDRSTGAVAAWVTNRLPRWRGVALQTTFQRRLGVPLVVDNDANLAALAEWTWGVGRGCDDFLMVTASDGVGGGLVVDGRIFRGGSGMAGDIGHMVVEPSGEVCYCGSRGCLTTLVSERSVLSTLQTSSTPRTSLQEVIEAAQHGDPACQRVLAEAGRYLGRALANAAKVMAPSVVAVGGALGGAGDLVFAGLRSTMEIHNLRSVAPATSFQPARLTHDAALLGGAAALLDHLGQGVSDLPSWMFEPDSQVVQLRRA